ncbi:alpha/beta fold hydrolase [Egicoccus sp. AB-alg6-2]|uniref:alpha/beta fold hydrolase n=1 Tax=Egicoccus sp. AB-alg6-2 TaxID=3242692 RepID=UPI00359E29EE
MIERFVEVDGVRLRTVVDGPAGPPVVVLHGGPGLPDYTAPLARLLDDVCRVHRYDQRGAGRSDRTPPWTLARLVADLDGLRNAWGFERWHVVGHSWGATLGLLYALEHPARTTSLSYLSGTGLAWHRWVDAFRDEQRRRLTTTERRRLDLLRARQRGPDEEVERFTLELRADSLDPDAAHEAIAALATTLAAGFRPDVNHRLNRQLEALDEHELERRCAALTEVPVLVVHGREDPRPAAAVEGLVAALPRVRYHLLDAGHELWHEQPAQLAQLLRGLLLGLNGPSVAPRA